MGNATLYAYAQGTDLENAQHAIEARLDALVAERRWISDDVWVVNQRTTGDAPDWDLGLNVKLSAKRPASWMDDVIAIATTLGELHRETGRSFVIGAHDGKTDTTKDVFLVDRDTPDLDALRAALAAVPLAEDVKRAKKRDPKRPPKQKVSA